MPVPYDVEMHRAFKASRTWQNEHPTADIDFPDYDAPLTDFRD